MSSSALGGRSRMVRLWLIVAVITFGRTFPTAAQEWPDWQMFLGAGVGAQLPCQSGRDPTDHHYQLEGTVGSLWTIPRTVLAAGVQADLCKLPDARLGPRVEFRMPWQMRRLQPFAWIGYFANNVGDDLKIGERAVIGGGVDIVRAHAVDIRLSVQDAFRKARWLDERRGCNPCMEPSTWFRHEVSVHVAAIWK